jgi:ubiquinone/menaquinone biosynthesis C-methylase UbiE
MNEMPVWAGEHLWQHNLDTTRNLVRQELVTRQLLEQLPPPDETLTVLDVGCGQGTQVVRLARQGYRVVGVDISPDLLELAHLALAKEQPEVGQRVELLMGDIHHLDRTLSRTFDVVLCHGVLMYMPSLSASLAELSCVVGDGGMMSVLTRNRAGIAMRAGMTGDWEGALDGFETRFYDNRVGMKGARADDPGEIFAALRQLGCNVTAWYGVRLFTDHWTDQSLPIDFDRLVDAEEEAGRRDPYRQLTSLTHVFATKL